MSNSNSSSRGGRSASRSARRRERKLRQFLEDWLETAGHPAGLRDTPDMLYFDGSPPGIDADLEGADGVAWGAGADEELFNVGELDPDEIFGGPAGVLNGASSGSAAERQELERFMSRPRTEQLENLRQQLAALGEYACTSGHVPLSKDARQWVRRRLRALGENRPHRAGDLARQLATAPSHCLLLSIADMISLYDVLSREADIGAASRDLPRRRLPRQACEVVLASALRAVKAAKYFRNFDIENGLAAPDDG